MSLGLVVQGPREYWWGAPSIGGIGGNLGSFGGNPRAKGNTGIKGLLGMLRKGVQGVYIYRALSQLLIGKLELLRSQTVLNYIHFTAPFTLLPHCFAACT